MRLDYFIVLGLALIGTATVVVFQDKVNSFDDKYAVSAFNSFKKVHAIKYLSATEEAYRMTVFIDNFLQIQEHNADSRNTYKLGVNQFTDLTKEEFKSRYLMNIAPPSTKNLPVANFTVKDTPTTVNWANVQNVLPAVKDQGQCGSCWAFSTAGMLEGIYNLNNKQQTSANSFAEQQLVDCCGAMGYGCEGCSGAWPTDAVSYVQNYGIVQETQYTYNAQDNACQTKFQNTGYKPGKQFQVTAGDANLRQAVTQQPISICVDASVWYTYYSGVFNNCSSSPSAADHAVLLVGYDANNNWIVRNSWGTSWGNAGYITLAPGNTCGLQNYAIYANYQ